MELAALPASNQTAGEAAAAAGVGVAGAAVGTGSTRRGANLSDAELASERGDIGGNGGGGFLSAGPTPATIVGGGGFTGAGSLAAANEGGAGFAASTAGGGLGCPGSCCGVGGAFFCGGGLTSWALAFAGPLSSDQGPSLAEPSLAAMQLSQGPQQLAEPSLEAMQGP